MAKLVDGILAVVEKSANGVSCLSLQVKIATVSDLIPYVTGIRIKSFE